MSRKLKKKAVEYDSDGSEISGSESEDDEKPEALLLWPITVSHKIDEYSPFYAMGPKGITRTKTFE